MIGLEKQKVQLLAHHESWAAFYIQESKKLLEIMNKDIVGIQHVGSSAIPELASKPVIDILVGLKQLEQGEKYIVTLQDIGYVYKGHMGKSNRYFFSKYKLKKNTFNLHLTEFGDLNWNKMIRFRDLLLTNRQIREKYNRLKLELSEKYPKDRNQYTQEKAVFIESALA